jgi:hypothetical protein
VGEAMKWLLRFLAWATLLAGPSWMLAAAYNRTLAEVTMGILGLPGPAAGQGEAGVPASHVLGVFAALCLASTRASLAKRLAALVIGLVCLVTIEVLTGMAAIAWTMEVGRRGQVPDFEMRVMNYLVSTPTWLSAPLLWLLLLGRWELSPKRDATRAVPGSR